MANSQVFKAFEIISKIVAEKLKYIIEQIEIIRMRCHCDLNGNEEAWINQSDNRSGA